MSRIEHRVQFVAIEREGERLAEARGMQLHRRHHTLPTPSLIPSLEITRIDVYRLRTVTRPTVSVPFMFRACWTDRNRLSASSEAPRVVSPPLNPVLLFFTHGSLRIEPIHDICGYAERSCACVRVYG